MKKLIIFLSIHFLVIHVEGQSLFVEPGGKINTETATSTKKIVNISNTKTGNDTTTTTEVTSIITNKLPERFHFFGTSAVNSTEELLAGFQGSQKFQFVTRLFEIDTTELREKKFYGRTGIDFNGGINVINLKPNSISKDSIDFVSLMFPETGNFGLMLNPVVHWGYVREKKGFHRFSSEISYSLRQTKIDSVQVHNSIGDPIGSPENITFSVLNFNVMPLRYTFGYSPKENQNIAFSLGMYFNWFNIPNEDVTNFNKLYPTDDPLFLKREKSYIPSIGLKMVCDINGFIIFADLRQNRKTDNFKDGNPYKGFVFNVGIAQNIKIFSF